MLQNLQEQWEYQPQLEAQPMELNLRARDRQSQVQPVGAQEQLWEEQQECFGQLQLIIPQSLQLWIEDLASQWKIKRSQNSRLQTAGLLSQLWTAISIAPLLITVSQLLVLLVLCLEPWLIYHPLEALSPGHVLLLFTKKAHNLRARTCTKTRDGGVQQNPVSILFPVAETEEERASGMELRMIGCIKCSEYSVSQLQRQTERALELLLRMMGCIKCSKRFLLPVAQTDRQTDRQSFGNGAEDDGMHQMQWVYIFSQLQRHKHTHTHTHRVLEMVLMRMLRCRKTLKIEKWRQEELHGFLEAQKRNI